MRALPVCCLLLLSAGRPTLAEPALQDYSFDVTAKGASELRAQIEAAVERLGTTMEQRAYATGYMERNVQKINFGQVIDAQIREGTAGHVDSSWYDVRLKQAGTDVASIRVYVGRRIPALVSVRTLQRYTQLSCSDFRSSFVDVRKVPAGALPVSKCSASVEEKSLRRALTAGDVLVEGDIAVRPKIVEGASVRVRVQVASVLVEEVGRALADADSGDAVKVRVSGSPEPIEGRVSSDGVVEVGI